MATIDLGRLGFVNKGTYNNSTTYEKNDLVQFTDGGILSTYLYIDSTAQSGQAPSSSGTAGSRWVYFAKGVADAVASAGNNKVLVTDGSGNLSPLAIGSAGQVVKVNSGANGFEFGTGGGLLKTTFTEITTTFNSTSDSYVATPVAASITPTSASSKIIIQCRISMGVDSDSYPRYKWHRAISGGSSGFINTEPTNPNGGASLGTYLSHRGVTGGTGGGIYQIYSISDTFRDAPNTTSAITYTLYGVRENGGSFLINQSPHQRDGNTNDYNQVSQSNVLLMEVGV